MSDAATMTKEQLARHLNGREYISEITSDEEREAKNAGLVVVFGTSDDLMEFRGAINDEAGAWQGTERFVDAKGLIPDFEQLDSDDKDGLRDYFAREKDGRAIEAVWDSDGYSWTYLTKIPHVTFEIMEGGDKYCRGIVFSLADLGVSAHG